MSARATGLLAATAALAALAAACGGGGETPPAETPPPATATAQPGAQPTPAPQATETPPGPQAEITPVTAFQITVSAENSGLRIRERPRATQDTPVLGAIYEGWEATVLGEARGQEVEPGKGDLWYYVEMSLDGETVRGFVYAPYVEQVE